MYTGSKPDHFNESGFLISSLSPPSPIYLISGLCLRYAVVASDDFPMASVYEFLDEMLEAGHGGNLRRHASGGFSAQVYESIDVASALDKASPAAP